MNKLEILIKALILAMAEYKSLTRVESQSLIEKTLESTEETKAKVKTFKDESDTIDKLKILLKNILEGDVIPDENLMVSIETILIEKPNHIKLIEKYIFKKDAKPTVGIVKKEIRNELKKLEAKATLSLALSKLVKPNSNIDKILDDTETTLSKIKEMQGLVDVSLVDEVDFDKRESVLKANAKAKDLLTGASTFKTGWECINNMTQGGISGGEFVTVSALRHNYKSSFVKSLLMQIMRLNKAVTKADNKKPLLVFISLEEEIDNVMFFFYAYLKYAIDGVEIKDKDREKISDEEMTDYVMKHCLNTGFTLRVYRFVPELFTYNKLFNLIEKLERQGFEVQGVVLDYVKKMSREGCRKDGPMGTDLLELFSRIRNFFSSRGCFFITPHQLNSQANNLIRTGLTPDEFVRHIADKNYYADSAQLGQEIDLELFLHKGKTRSETVLHIARGKHRRPTIAPEEYLTTILKFLSKVAPIPEDNNERSACTKAVSSEEEFDF